MKSTTHRKLAIECLERRQLLSASPLAAPAPVTLATDGSATVSGKIVHPGDAVGYRFTAPASGTLVVRESSTGSSSFPTALSVYNGSQHQLSSLYGNPAGSQVSCVGVPVTKGSTYYAVAAASQGCVGTFQLQICIDDAGNTGATANNLALINSGGATLIGSGVQYGKIDYPGDVDVYKFTAIVPGGSAGSLGSMAIQMTPQANNLRTELSIYDANYLNSPSETPLAASSAIASGTAYSQFSATVSSGSVYYLVMSADLNTTGPYKIQLSTAKLNDAFPHTFSGADAVWQSAPINIPADPANSTTGPVKTISSTIAYPGDADYIRIASPVTGSMTIQQVQDTSQGSTLDSYLYVYNANQNLLISNNNVGGTLNSRVQFQVQAGVSYYVKATGFGNSTGAYKLLFSTNCTTTDDFPQVPPFTAANPATTIAIDPNSGAGQQAGSIDYLGDADWFSFSPNVTGVMNIQETVISGNLAPQVSAYSLDSSNMPTILLSSATPGAIATFNVTLGQTYYVKATGSSETAGQYVLQAYCAAWEGIQDPSLSALVKQLFTRDGMLNRADMMQIFNYTVSGGVLSATDFSDLGKIVGPDATYFKMPDYVRALSRDVVLGSPANAYFTGGANLNILAAPPTLGNLHAGSTKAQMTKLVGKWFLGTDLPNPEIPGQDLNGNIIVAAAPKYVAVSGTLFGKVNGTPTPVLNDAQQGALGDCYFLATMAGIANVNPTAIENMFLDNKDGTWTIRFYYNGVPDYVTVNNQLPVTPAGLGSPYTTGALIYNGAWTITSPASTSNVLWLSLLEKAYAQWNEVGEEGHGAGTDGYNSYYAVAGGWSQPVYDQTLGPSDKSVAYDNSLLGAGIPTTASVLIDALNGGETATVGTLPQGTTNPSWTDDNLLYTGHMYTVVSYNPSTQTFQLHNPWGSVGPETGGPVTQPLPMTWAQLNLDCDYMSIANPNTTAAFAAGVSAAAKVASKVAVARPKVLFYATATADGANSRSAAAAWIALHGSQSTQPNDSARAAANDLALLQYLRTDAA